MLALLIGLAALVLLSTPAVAWLAWVRGRSLATEIRTLQARVAELEAAALPPATVDLPSDGARLDPQPGRPPDLAPGAADPEVAEVTVRPSPAHEMPGMEGRFAQRWLVWLGAVALGLGGLFAAAWAIEQGLAGPGVRLAGAALVGLALVALGERARRGAVPGSGDLVAPALVGGGLCALYGAAAAAHLGYAFVGSGPAFVLLALTSGFGVALGLRFGPLVATLGAIGAYATPAFVVAGTPSAGPLSLYLAVVALALATQARLVGRGWVAWVNLAGALAWQLAWLAGLVAGASPTAAGIHLLALGGAGVVAALAPGDLAGRRLGAAGRAAVGAGALLHLPHLWAWGHAAGPVVTLALLSAVVAAAAWHQERERWLSAVTAAAGLLAAATWRLALLDEPVSRWRDPRVALDPVLWLPPEATPLASALTAVALAYGVGGFLASRRARRPGYWAGLSAGVPLLALGAAYARLEGLAVSPGFAALGLALAGLLLLAAERSRSRDDLVPALGSYAVGVVGALALAVATALEEAALTVAVAALLPATAWVGRRLGLEALRGPAWVAAGVALARVALDVDLRAGVGVNGAARLLYAYGAPLLAFSLAARLFRPGALTEFLTGGAVLLWLLLAAQLVRALVGPAGSLGLAERALDTLALLGTGYALLRWHRAEPGALVPRFGWRLLAGAGGLAVLLVQLLGLNPLASGEAVGPWPLLNLLLVAYAAPALLALLLAGAARRAGHLIWAGAGAVAGHVLAFAWLTLELRHLFQGSVLTGPTGQGEWLAYSAGWLAWAGLLLAAGVALDRRPLRTAGLAIAAVAVAKTFLFDLAGLGGLYRAVSFLGLGLSLVGIGWLYRRLAIEATARRRPSHRGER